MLVIEDDDQDYKLLLRHLHGNDVSFDADRVANAKQLVEQLANGPSDWNLILADHSLPDIDVRTTLHWLMAKLPNAPVIMVSGSIGEENAVDLLLAGVDDFVSKENLARLVPAMERTVRAVAIRQSKMSAEAELELRNRALEAASNGVVISEVGDDMPVVYVNPAFERITGYAAAELIGRNCRILQRDDRVQPGLDAIREALREQGSCSAVLRNYHKDGSLFWNKLSIAPVANRRGRITHYVGIQEDISESVAQQQRLRESAAVFENAQEGMTITGLDGSIVEVNPAFTEITGYARDEVVGENPRLLQSGRHGRDFYQGMWASLTQTSRWSGEIWNRRKSGEVYPQLLTISTVRDEHGMPINYVAVFADISRLKQSEEQLEFLAHHDPLTELPNRLLFNARLTHAMEHASRNDYLVAVLFLDLDRFKNVNDAHGHPAGDGLLRLVAERLSSCVRKEDTVARIGGDEFIILLERIEAPANAGAVGDKILRAFTEPFEVDGRNQFVSASIGISIFPRDGEDAAAIIGNADTALYQAKDQGRATYRFYAPEYTEQATERATIENDLYSALENDELRLHYQPQLDLHSGAIVGVEALVRWQHPRRGLLPPGLFVPVAEESGQIREVGQWVLETACAQAAAWLNAGIDFGRISVNIAGPQIRQGDLHDRVGRVLAETGLPPDRLDLEVTETFVMHHVEQNIDDMRRLRDLGIHLSIDDFGTGHSSLSYLKRLPIDRLKIDRSFVRDLPDDPEDAAIAAAVIALGRSLGLVIVAEGVETQAQRRFLLDEGCPLGQGFLFSRPLPADELLAWIGEPGRPGESL